MTYDTFAQHNTVEGQGNTVSAIDVSPHPGDLLKYTSQPITCSNESSFPANVQTLLNLVNGLPENIDRTQGANIIRATLQSMGQATGLSVESILGEAHQSQSELLATIQTNLQKISECQTLIENLEMILKKSKHKHPYYLT